MKQATPQTVVVMATGRNHRGDFPDLNYRVPVEVDAALLPDLLALEGVVEISAPSTVPPLVLETVPPPVPEPEPILETSAADPAPSPKE